MTNALTKLALAAVMAIPALAPSAGLAAPQNAMQITPTIPSSYPPTGTVFFDETFSVAFHAGRVRLTLNADATGDVVADDALTVDVSNSRGSSSITHQYADCNSHIITPTQHDITSMMAPGMNTVRIRLFDVCGAGVASSAYWLVITDQPTSVKAAPAVAEIGPGPSPTVHFPNLNAELREVATGEPIVGRTVTFSAGGTEVCSANTDSSGLATCAGEIAGTLQVILNLGYEAEFAGDPYYLASSDRGPLLRVLDHTVPAD